MKETYVSFCNDRNKTDDKNKLFKPCIKKTFQKLRNLNEKHAKKYKLKELEFR